MRATIAIMLAAALLAGPVAVSAQQSLSEAVDVLDRRVAGLLRIGTVHSIDHDSGTLQVRLGPASDGGDFLTGWIRWPDYMTPQEGQLALIACPGGSLHFATLVSLLPLPGDQAER